MPCDSWWGEKGRVISIQLVKWVVRCSVLQGSFGSNWRPLQIIKWLTNGIPLWLGDFRQQPDSRRSYKSGRIKLLANVTWLSWLLLNKAPPPGITRYTSTPYPRLYMYASYISVKHKCFLLWSVDKFLWGQAAAGWMRIRI